MIKRGDNYLKRMISFLREDSWQSYLVSILLMVLSIKFIPFPLLSLATGSSLPLVVIESCSMYQGLDYDDWWARNERWYSEFEIDKEEFDSFIFNRGLNKGDIILVWGHSDYDVGDIIIFEADRKYPIIHRMVTDKPISTKGDNNNGWISGESQLPEDKNINPDKILGKAVLRIPFIGWIKLIFYEFAKPSESRGFCDPL